MEWFKYRFNYLFQSTRGLALVGFTLVLLTVSIWGTLSGPMAEMGVSDFMVRTFKFRLVEEERAGRIIMLYHSLAIAAVAVEVYFITAAVKMKPQQQSTINATVTIGYICTMVFGLLFAYFGYNYVFHGLFLFGLSLMFFGGCMLAAALWPWRREYPVEDNAYAHTRKGVDLERVAFFTMAVATLGSSMFGAVAGSFYGNGFETFLAEDVVREVQKTPLQLAVIGHLHIMLTLVGVAITLLIGRWVDFKGILHKLAMPLMIAGTIVVTLGVWAVVPFEPIAHTIIYGGSTFILLAGLLLVIFTWDKLIRQATAGKGKTSLKQKLAALLSDPLRFGATWQMVFMNFNTSFVGIYMAINLEEIFRRWPASEERIVLTGHWHVLATIIATIMLFYFADMLGVRGKARGWLGWTVIVSSDLAFAGATLYGLKRLFVIEAAQQPLVDVLTVLIDIGLAAMLVALALFMLWRLYDLLSRDGLWKQDFDMPEVRQVEERAEADLPAVTPYGEHIP
jgi:hypothetical protein